MGYQPLDSFHDCIFDSLKALIRVQHQVIEPLHGRKQLPVPQFSYADGNGGIRIGDPQGFHKLERRIRYQCQRFPEVVQLRTDIDCLIAGSDLVE